LKKVLLVLLFSISVSNDYVHSSNEAFNNLLFSYVDSVGNVNYQGIIDSPFSFNEYFSFIEEISPVNHPEYFKSQNDEKAYWINVYNALIIKLMIDNPNKDILDISIFGVFIFSKKFKVGGQMISPNHIEHKILRKMNDPRIHFAINCASKSCPPLGNRILIGKNIEKQLNQKTISFINDIDNVYISHEEETIYLNKIFKWFKKDFKNVIQFITEFLIEDIDYDRIKNYKIKYYKYDWSSNQLSN